ncbi:hypothetical protein ABW19_dt0201354 [Dactylella cylindrospora]|nr:hypothetical protein ABW19_dt0201354 [Dactylella cylindrospora]
MPGCHKIPHHFMSILADHITNRLHIRKWALEDQLAYITDLTDEEAKLMREEIDTILKELPWFNQRRDTLERLFTEEDEREMRESNGVIRGYFASLWVV